MNKRIVIIGAILFVLAIALGAFGAHGLKKYVDTEQLKTFEVGVRYQFYQAIAFLILGFNADKIKFNLKSISTTLLIGSISFSGSIYLLSIAEILNISKKIIGPITPIGGLIMIIAWILFIVKL
ncbi:MAG: DUF423 domain-containing protein, partial [Crocinitomicaceae bacterium]|nr:DUF423 domain-containing protein [Crocinitomicaceae bacterium]